MKLQFKEQQFQLDAVAAVVDCFEGQALKTARFTLERSKELVRKAKQSAQNMSSLDFKNELNEDIGYRNSPIQIPESLILENIRKIQGQDRKSVV